MARITAVFLLLLFMYSGNAAAQNDVKKILERRNFAELKSYFDTLDTKCSGSSEWFYYREIMPYYWEGKIMVYDCESKSDTRSFNIDFLVTNSSIFFWRVNHDLLAEPDSIKATDYVDSFTDVKEYRKLEADFESLYKSPLNKNDLFNRRIYSLSGCGFGGTATKESYELKKMILRHDTASLQRWLRCANAEKQLYAIAGFMALKKKYYKIDTETLKLIKLISHKNGTIWCCEACLLEYKEIGQAVEDVLKD